VSWGRLWGDFLLVGLIKGGLAVVDVRNPALPTTVTTLQHGTHVQTESAPAMVGDLIYAAFKPDSGSSGDTGVSVHSLSCQ
jgi:hypothetical protein